MRLAIVALSAVLWIPAAFGESKDCGNPSVVVPDGRVTQSNFEAASGSVVTYYYGFYAQVGHSYSVEFVPTNDNELGRTAVRFYDLTVYGPNDVLIGCRGASSLGATLNSAISPAVSSNSYGGGRRVSFVQKTAGLDVIAASNDSGGGAYSYRIVDTTLFSPRWSTYAVETQWGFMNVSDMTIQGTLYVYDVNNRLLAAPQFSIPAASLVFRETHLSDLAMPRNTAGYVVFAHNGPPHAILADAYIINGPGTVVVYSKFDTRAP